MIAKTKLIWIWTRLVRSEICMRHSENPGGPKTDKGYIMADYIPVITTRCDGKGDVTEKNRLCV